MRFTSQHKAINQKEYGKAVSPLRYDSLALILSWSIFVVYGVICFQLFRSTNITIDGAVSSSADKKWYLYRVSDMKKFIIKHIGGTPLKGSTANSFKGKKVVIVFNDCNWSDATGHVDLFNGIQCEYEDANDYFNNCNSELLYTLK